MSDVKPEIKQEQEQPQVAQTTEQNGSGAASETKPDVEMKSEVETKPEVKAEGAKELSAEDAEALGAKVAKQSKSLMNPT